MTATGRLSRRDLRELQNPGMGWYLQMTLLAIAFGLLCVFPRTAATIATRLVIAYNSLPVADLPLPDGIDLNVLAESVPRSSMENRIAAGNVQSAQPGQYGDVRLSQEQVENAHAIAKVGVQVGASERDIEIAIAAAMQESSLKNLEHGDDWWFEQNGWGKSDSIGLFQQRDTWGDGRNDPETAARKFYLGGASGQAGLLDIEDRDGMSLAQAAQTVQGSAFPDHYAKWEIMAEQLTEEMVK